jgi:hypothetical protein
MGRSILAVVLGVILSVAILIAIEGLNSLFYPLPEGFDSSNPEALREYVASLPAPAFVTVVVGWFLGTFVGSSLAARLARRKPAVHAVIVGAILTGAGVLNLRAFPHPLWVWVAGLAAFLGASVLAARLAPAACPAQATPPAG